MTEIIIFREKLKSIYAKSDVVITYVFRFLYSFMALYVINAKTGYDRKLSNPLFMVLIVAVCTFLPGGVAALVCSAVLIIQLLAMSVEYAVIAALVILIMFLIYFMFATKTSYIIFLTPILFFIKLPYVVPVIVGLISGFTGIIPVLLGIYVYFLMDFSPQFALVASSFGEDGIIQKIMYIVENTLLNREMFILFIVFAATIIIITIIKKMSIDYSWIIGIVVGVIVEVVIIVMSYMMLDLEINIVMLVVGAIVGIIIGLALDFFILSVDYARTEHVQFEDDDYYYYVKAVPKITVAKTEVQVKKINSRRGDETDDEQEELPEEDSAAKNEDTVRNVFEEDIEDLDEK